MAYTMKQQWNTQCNRHVIQNCTEIAQKQNTTWNRNGIHNGAAMEYTMEQNGIHNGADMEYIMKQKWNTQVEQTWNTQWNRNENTK